MRARSTLLTLATQLLELTLSACGGGGSDDAPSGSGITAERVTSCGKAGGALR